MPGDSSLKVELPMAVVDCSSKAPSITNSSILRVLGRLVDITILPRLFVRLCCRQVEAPM